MEPGEGFETRGTKLSDERLALLALKGYISSPSEIFFSNRKRREAEEAEEATILPLVSPYTLASENITIDYDEYGVGFEPTEADLNNTCVMYEAIGNQIQYAYLDTMAKLIFEVESFDKLFTLAVMHKLCELDGIVEETLSKYPNLSLKANTLMRHSLNLPNYVLCFDAKSEKFCNNLSEKNILSAKSLILNCKLNPGHPNCQLRLYSQLFDYILENNDFDKKAFKIGAIVPINIYTKTKETDDFYADLLARLKSHFTDSILLKGAFFDQKLTLFKESLIPDLILGGVSFILVLLCFLLYSRSVLFTLIVLSAVLLSLTIAYSVYTILLGFDFFPFVNLLTLVLMISIGADDAFLLLVYFREKKREKKLEDMSSICIDKDKQAICGRALLRASLPHSLISMFVTSATTMVAFLSNLSSHVIVVRCFSIYAAITIITNYCLVLLLLPSAMMITQNTSTFYSKLAKKCLTKQSETLFDRFAKIFSTFVYKFRYFSLTLMMISIGTSIYTFHNPGIQLPETNPMQYLRSSHPYEWFDNHQGDFRFEANRVTRIVINYARGIKPNSDASSVNPRDQGSFSFSNFDLKNFDDIKKLQKISSTLKNLNPKYANYTMWIDYFIEYLQVDACTEEDKSCCIKGKTFNKTCFLIYAKRNFCQDFPESMRHTPADCPLFDEEKELKAYYISIPSQHRLSMAYSETQKVFNDIKRIEEEVKKASNDEAFLLLSEPQITKMYDLMSKLFSSTLISVLISVGVSLIVIIFCTWDLMISIVSIIAIGSVILNTLAVVIWMGWKINVVEATIIVLTIGLSFDYTLHYAVAHKHAHDPSIQMRIRSCNFSAGRAVLAGAMTSIFAGFPLLFAKTNAFYEIGCFIIIMSLLSLITATFFFPSLLAIVLELRFWRRKRVSIDLC